MANGWSPPQTIAPARLWDVGSAKAIGQPMKHSGEVFSVQFSSDGQRVVTASNNGTATLWDGATGEQIGESIDHPSNVMSAQFSPDGQRVVTALENGTVQLWNLANRIR